MFSEVKIDPMLKHTYNDQRQLYVIIKKLNFLQRSKLEGKIDNSKYESLKQQYIENFNFIAKARQLTLEQFCEEFNIDSVQESYAIQILKGES